MFLFEDLGIYVCGIKFCAQAHRDPTVDFDLPKFTWNVINEYGTRSGSQDGIEITYVVQSMHDIPKYSTMQRVQEVLDTCP